MRISERRRAKEMKPHGNDARNLPAKKTRTISVDFAMAASQPGDLFRARRNDDFTRDGNAAVSEKLIPYQEVLDPGKLAEREGFEPPVSLRPQKFSRLPQ